MKNNKFIIITFLLLSLMACKSTLNTLSTSEVSLPEQYKGNQTDSNNIAFQTWQDFFKDPNLHLLIDSALKRNQELNIMRQEYLISTNEIRSRKGEYLPFLNLGAAGEVEKSSENSRLGVFEEHQNKHGDRAIPEPYTNLQLGLNFSWELDVWKKLRNAKKAAVMESLATKEHQKFMQTELIAEIVAQYYELLALDQLSDLFERNIEIQEHAINIVEQQKKAGQVNQLAVNRFKAQSLSLKSYLFQINQQIIEGENKLKLLCGGSISYVDRSAASFLEEIGDSMSYGIPQQLLYNRPDVKQAEFDLVKAKLDVKVARAQFFPSIGIHANVGFNSFDPGLLFNPKSLLLNAAGELMMPLINRNAIQAAYKTANNKQIQTVYEYDKTLLTAFYEVENTINSMVNTEEALKLKTEEVEILEASVQVSNNLFQSARADYTELLFTQREALEAKVEWIEIQLQALHNKVYLYKALGGGWR